MPYGTCEKGHENSCSCQLATPSVSQTLDELDFSRGIWTAALDGDEAELLNCLQRRNIHPDVKDSSGYSALHYAARCGHLNICQILLDYSASPNVQTNSGKATPLHRAAYCGHVKIVDLLIKYGADSSLVDSDGKLPLHKAAEKGHGSVIEACLKAYPAGTSILDNRGRKPVDCVPETREDIKDVLNTEKNQSRNEFDSG